MGVSLGPRSGREILTDGRILPKKPFDMLVHSFAASLHNYKLSTLRDLYAWMMVRGCLTERGYFARSPNKTRAGTLLRIPQLLNPPCAPGTKMTKSSVKLIYYEPLYELSLNPFRLHVVLKVGHSLSKPRSRTLHTRLYT